MMEGQRIRKLLFIILFLALFLLVARLYYPFLTVFLWSALIYAFLEPLQRRASHRRDGSERTGLARSIIAGLFAVGGVLVIVVPCCFLALAVLRQAGDLLAAVMRLLDSRPDIFDLSPASPLVAFARRVSGGRLDLSGVDLVGEAKSFIASRAGSIIGFSGTLLKRVLDFAVALAFMVFTLYFFFVDGRHLVGILVRAIPIETRYTTLFLRKLKETGRQLALGYFVVAFFQASMMFGLCLAFRIEGSLVIACLTALASFVPMIGTALVWLPVAATIALSGNLVAAAAFLVLAAVLVSMLDNFIRPLLLRERLKIHPLLIFFAILGGLRVLGFNGLLLGPLILMLFFAAAELFDKVYERERFEDEPASDGGPPGAP